MTYETIRAAAVEVDLWLSVLVNSWIVSAAILLFLKRPQTQDHMFALLKWSAILALFIAAFAGLGLAFLAADMVGSLSG